MVALLLGAAAPAQAQDLPPHQALETRHVCTSQPIHVAPAGATGRMLNASEEVTLLDVTFGPDGAAWFALDHATGKGLERATGYLPVTEVAHFCDTPATRPGIGAERLQSYLAPPNTCHALSARTDTIAELNDHARSMAAYGPAMSGYRLHSGGYALSLGLLATDLAGRIASHAAQTGLTCVSGADFAEALVFDGAGFAPADPDAALDEAARLAAARAARASALESGDPKGMKTACDLGLGAACTAFASLIHDVPKGPDRGPAVVTRYALLGCMAGDLEGCQMAVNRQGNTLELTRETAFPDAGADEGRVTTELAKRLCDARDRFGCVLLARGIAPNRTPSLMEAASNFAANLIACRQGIGWICEQLVDGFGLVTKARGADPNTDERHALAGIEARICTPGPREPNQRGCTAAYYLYRDFLNYGSAAALDSARVGQATSMLADGCAAGDPVACGTLANLPDFWPEAMRRAASARAIALCAAQDPKDSICESLGAALDPTLPEAAPALRARYEMLAQSCLTPGNGAYQDCLQALHGYAALKAPDGLAQVEIMLNRACSPTNINGCQALARIYDDEAYEVQGVKVQGRDNPDARLAALRMGCRSGQDAADAGNTCAALANAMAAGGDSDGARDVRGDACETLIAGGDAHNAWICYDAAKLALDRNERLPDALRWAEFVCDGTDTSVAPYGCKLAGNILSRGLGPARRSRPCPGRLSARLLPSPGRHHRWRGLPALWRDAGRRRPPGRDAARAPGLFASRGRRGTRAAAGVGRGLPCFRHGMHGRHRPGLRGQHAPAGGMERGRLAP